MTADTKSDRAFDQRQLLDLGMEHVRRISRRWWTDHNTHDPGVTTLELLSYALTDLAYRASWPLEDLLANMAEQFYSAGDILPQAPLTVLDYRKLLIDRCHVRNAWLQPTRQALYTLPGSGRLTTKPTEPAGEVRVDLSGLYDVLLDGVTEREKVLKLAKETLNRNRNLCEDFCKIGFVEEKAFVLVGSFDLVPSSAIHSVRDDILAAVQDCLTPGVPRYSLAEFLAKPRGDGSTRTLAESLEGPWLEHGFIDDEELSAAELRRDIPQAELIEAVRRVEGVRAVRDLRLVPMDEGSGSAGASGIPDHPKAVVDWNRSRLTFYRGTTRVIVPPTGRPAPASLSAEVVAAPMQHDRATLIPIPLGRVRRPPQSSGEPENQTQKPAADEPSAASVLRAKDVSEVAEYTSFQLHFPEIYRLGEGVLPADDPSDPLDRKGERHRQRLVCQFKGYLLFFDQVMADYLAQLSQISRLFTRRYEDSEDYKHSTYFHQVVRSLPGYERIYCDKWEEAFNPTSPGKSNPSSLESEKSVDRRTRLLEHLAARVGESFRDYDDVMTAVFRKPGPDLYRAKFQFLGGYSALGGERSLGFDLTSPPAKVGEDEPLEDGPLTGFRRRIAACLGIPLVQRPALTDINAADTIVVRKVKGGKFEFDLHGGEPMEPVITGCAKHASEAEAKKAAREAVERALDLNHFRQIERGRNKLGFAITAENRSELARSTKDFTEVEKLKAQVFKFHERLVKIHNVEGVHVIEMILLRPEGPDTPGLPDLVEHCPEPAAGDSRSDPYSHRIRVILPGYAGRFTNLEFRRFAEKRIREETPAHVVPTICWIDRPRMKALESAFRQWRSALCEWRLKAGVTTSDQRKVIEDFIKALYQCRNTYPEQRLPREGEEHDSSVFRLGQGALVPRPDRTP